MTKHTEGPWCAIFSPRLDKEPIVVTPPMIEYKNEAAEDNARLIAAAPEMLEALNLIRECCRDAEGATNNRIVKLLEIIKDHANKSINKAEGNE